jgi:hypothetical protein
VSLASRRGIAICAGSGDAVGRGAGEALELAEGEALEFAAGDVPEFAAGDALELADGEGDTAGAAFLAYTRSPAAMKTAAASAVAARRGTSFNGSPLE